MALKKTLAERFLKMSKTNCRISTSSCSVPTRIPQTASSGSGSKVPISPDPGDSGIFRRLFHMRAILQPELRPSAFGANMMDTLRALDIAGDRIRLDGLIPPTPSAEEEPELTVEEARKLLMVTQLEAVKSRLRDTGRSWVAYSDFIRVIRDTCPDPDQAGRVAKTLDESGSVIVIGNVVYLQPDQVVKAIGGLIPLPATNPNDPRRKELQELEKRKASIDKEADVLARREIWAGLGFLVVQTAGFMRLTFWELSWDVMEPICFYVTSMYCVAGYVFFLRTSKEPSFEGFYKSRFVAKQRKLMKLHDFDVERYNELRKICYPNSSNSLDVDSFDQEKMCQTN